LKVSEAIGSRKSIRAFLDTPVEEKIVRQILTVAARAPSGGNLQPWHVYALCGEARDGLVAIVKKTMADQTPDAPEYEIYPKKLPDPYRSRRYKVGEDMYAAIDVGRDDKAGRAKQFSRNFDFFGAPVGLIFTIDRIMQQGQWSDLGMFIENVMLLAREHGLETCPQEAWAIWSNTIRNHLDIPDEQMIFCGMAVGYADKDAAINSLETERAALEEFVSFRGF
jgi:nitroreductase